MKAFLFLMVLVFTSLPNQAATLALPVGIIETPLRVAPAIKLADMDGQVQELARLRGHWVFVHFWASWCGPCRKEMPNIQTLVNRQSPGLAYMIINTAESEDTVFAFLGSVAPDLQSLLDRDGRVTEQWQPRGLPATYLVDPNGVIRYQALGGRPWHEQAYTDFLTRLAGQP